MASMRSCVQALLLAVVVVQQLVVAQNCGPSVGLKCTGNKECCSKYGYCGTDEAHCGNGNDKNCQPDYGYCPPGCFPGHATVLMRNGIEKLISELSIGDEVAVGIDTTNGKLLYDEVYANGHTDSTALSEFVAITLRNGNATKTLQLTSDHFVPIVTSKGKLQYKKAKDVVIGNTLIAINEQGLEFTVIGLEKEMLRGLFNPFTMSGTIVVNNVLASCHSDWFLDSTFDRIGLSHLLPSTYQAILAPIRMIYKQLGSDVYKSLYAEIDAQYNIAKSGSHFSGYLNLLGQVVFSSGASGQL